jgi:hypothetical protein
MSSISNILQKLRDSVPSASPHSETYRQDSKKRLSEALSVTLTRPKRRRLEADDEYYSKLRDRLDRIRKEDAEQKEHAAKDIESVRKLRLVYLYGLQKISKLQDLREAPDAIMPGNFIDQEIEELVADKKSKAKETASSRTETKSVSSYVGNR